MQGKPIKTSVCKIEPQLCKICLIYSSIILAEIIAEIMKNLLLKICLLFSLLVLLLPMVFAAPNVKVMVLDFALNDLTDLPNPPEELARIAYFNVAFKQKLVDDGVELVPVNDKIKEISVAQSATYLFDHTDIAASLAEDSGADYILIGVAMKPTYLFVYPRLLLVDVKTKRKAFTAYVQMEGSWLEKTTTASSAKNLANKVLAELKKLTAQAN